MLKELPLPRVLVTANDADRRSGFISDAPAHAVRTVAERPGYRVSNIWMTTDSPAPVDAPDRIGELKGLAPPPNGSLLRVIDYPPEPNDPVERERMFAAMFEKMFPDGRHLPENPPHPGMHATDTLDYVICLQGEIYAVMDHEERLMRAGDILIQRGTPHAWSNRSNDFARIAFILLDGRRGA